MEINYYTLLTFKNVTGSQENYTDYIMSLKSPLLQFKNVVYDTPEVRGRAALVETFSPKRPARAKMTNEVLSKCPLTSFDRPFSLIEFLFRSQRYE